MRGGNNDECKRGEVVTSRKVSMREWRRGGNNGKGGRGKVVIVQGV